MCWDLFFLEQRLGILDYWGGEPSRKGKIGWFGKNRGTNLGKWGWVGSWRWLFFCLFMEVYFDVYSMDMDVFNGCKMRYVWKLRIMWGNILLWNDRTNEEKEKRKRDTFLAFQKVLRSLCHIHFSDFWSPPDWSWAIFIFTRYNKWNIPFCRLEMMKET